MSDMPKTYDPSTVETTIYEQWLAADVFAPDGRGSRADASKPPFVIIQPPPNVTGALHLGHAQRTAVEDALTRHARMSGRPTLWLPGMDHASIAAQVVLDRILATEGESRASLGRDAYLDRMRAFVATTRPIMRGQLERVGGSLDWGRERFTMDDGSARAVRTAFKRLFDDGLAYRTEALVNWCPGCRTSVSDLEVIADPGDRHAVDHPLPPHRAGRPARTRRRDRRGDDTAGDAARRHGRGRASGRRPLRVARGAPGAHPLRRARRAGHRRRRGRPRLRHGRREGHAGARPDGPGDRRAPQPGAGHGPRRCGPRQLPGGLRGPRPARGAPPHRGRPRGGRRPGRHRAARDGRGALPAQRRRHRATAQDTVVPAHGAAGRQGPRGRARRTDAVRAAALREGLLRLAGADPRLEPEPPAVVGPPHPGLVLPGRPRDRLRPGRGPRRVRRLRPAGGRAGAGSGHLRHVVQQRPVALLHPGLAGPDGRPGALLPGLGHGDRLRHHLLLGRPDDDAGGVADRAGPLRGGLPLGPRARPLRPEDVQDQGQRRRPARRDRRHRGRQPALRAGQRGRPGRRPAARPDTAGGRPQLRQQAVERGPLRPWRATGRPPRRLTARPAGPRRPRAGRALAAGRPRRHDRRGHACLRVAPAGRRDARAARGHLEHLLRPVPGAGQGPPGGPCLHARRSGTPPGGCSCGRSTATCASSTR